MAAMNRTNFVKDLQEGLNAHFGMTYRDLGDEWSTYLDTETTNKAFVEDVLEYGFDSAQLKDEGGDFATASGGQGYVSRYTIDTVGLSFELTQEAIEDNLYGALGPKYAKALARAFKNTKEIYAAAILNNATSTAGGDGVSLLNTAHPTLAGNQSNKLATPADLSETSLEDILIQIRKAKDHRGVPVALRALRLIVPPELEFSARRILGSELRTGTNENDINAIKSMGIFGSAPTVVTRMTDSNMWLVKTDAPEGMKLIQRVSMQRGMSTVQTSGNLKYWGRERYKCGTSDWRCVFGSEGA